MTTQRNLEFDEGLYPLQELPLPLRWLSRVARSVRRKWMEGVGAVVSTLAKIAIAVVFDDHPAVEVLMSEITDLTARRWTTLFASVPSPRQLAGVSGI